MLTEVKNTGFCKNLVEATTNAISAFSKKHTDEFFSGFAYDVDGGEILFCLDTGSRPGEDMERWKYRGFGRYGITSENYYEIFAHTAPPETDEEREDLMEVISTIFLISTKSFEFRALPKGPSDTFALYCYDHLEQAEDSDQRLERIREDMFIEKARDMFAIHNYSECVEAADVGLESYPASEFLLLFKYIGELLSITARNDGYDRSELEKPIANLKALTDGSDDDYVRPFAIYYQAFGYMKAYDYTRAEEILDSFDQAYEMTEARILKEYLQNARMQN